MLVLDYVLTVQKDCNTKGVTDVIVNVSEEGCLFVDAVDNAWFLGRADGAPFSKIILTDKAENEYLLPLKLETAEEEALLEQFFQQTRQLKVCSISSVGQDLQTTHEIPLLAFESEHASIVQSMHCQFG